MLILGIETSCDDTALALVEGTQVLGSVRIGQEAHAAFGGVVPELAARAHQAHWRQGLEDLFAMTLKSWADIDLIAVTIGPGLQPSLLTGTTLASYFSLLYQIPVIGVHHILGHILSVELERERNPQVELPSLVLTVSGGHTEVHLRKQEDQNSQVLKSSDSQVIQRLGQTLDDAAGEAFDKVAKMLRLGYPGGPEVSKWAEKGDIHAFKLPLIYINPQSLDFSFSGLKAAVRRIVEKRYPQWLSLGVSIEKPVSRSKEEEQFVADLCASFEHTVFLTFKKKLERCRERYPDVRQIHFVGGVSANRYIVHKLSNSQVELLTPTSLSYCTDNGAMIAYAGGWLYDRNPSRAKIQHVEPSSRLDLEAFLEPYT